MKLFRRKKLIWIRDVFIEEELDAEKYDLNFKEIDTVFDLLLAFVNTYRKEIKDWKVLEVSRDGYSSIMFAYLAEKELFFKFKKHNDK